MDLLDSLDVFVHITGNSEHRGSWIHHPQKLPAIPGSSKKTAILLHVVTSHLIPPRPLDQCCCPMHAGIRTEMAVFFEGLSKQSDVTTLNWGKGGMQVSSQWVWQDGCFFEEPGLSPGKIFWFTVRMCKHKLEQTTFCTCHNLNPNTLSSSKLLPSKQRSTRFFWFLSVQTQAWTNSLLHVPQPQSKDTFTFTAATHKQRMCLHASRSRIAQTVFCTVHVQCTHSARYSARHSARPQNAVNTMGLAFCWQVTKNYKNIFFFCVFWLFLGKYVVFTAFCGRALWRAL